MQVHPRYLGLESVATTLQAYDTHLVHGLLQTPDYARASVRVGFPDATDDEAERRIALRLARQQILTRPGPPRLWVIIDEAALRRPAATIGPAVMRAQLDRLIDANDQPGITVQVMPFTVGLHPAMHGVFYLLRFPDEQLPDIVYGESMTSAFYLDKPEEAAAYLEVMDRICAQAAPADKTAKVLRDIGKEI
jgi:hypothetical protein